MTQPTYLRILPLLFLLLLAACSYLLDFNGLYGQDAHEYLRQSRVFFLRMQGLPHPPAGPGESELAGGYPLLGALLQFTGMRAGLAMQMLSWLAAAACLWLFELILRVLSPGARPESRWLYGILALALAPYFLRASLTVMSDALGLAFTLAALYCCLLSLEQMRRRYIAGFAVFAVLAVTTRYALIALLLLPGLAIFSEMWRMRRFADLGVFVAIGLLASGPFWWLKIPVPVAAIFIRLQDWSFWNLFQKTFTQTSGTISYALPNIAYLFYPILHPGFCITLPGLLLLFKRTDIGLYAKRVLVMSMVVYLFFLGGIPHQNLRFLLSAYAVLLLLMFPAWDRFFAYGLYFFKRLTYALIGLALACQLVFSFLVFKPVWDRNRLEYQIAEGLKTELQSGDILFAFDVDIALKSYFPKVEFRNLWIKRYADFPAGSYILFNEAGLKAQWAGKAPMLNWEAANSQHNLLEVRKFPGGWTLYRLVK